MRSSNHFQAYADFLDAFEGNSAGAGKGGHGFVRASADDDSEDRVYNPPSAPRARREESHRPPLDDDEVGIGYICVIVHY